jgi:DNA polymerase-1
VLAHYEDDILLEAYKKDPTQDLHQYTADLIVKETGRPFGRKQAKTCSFAILYGSGLATLARQLESDIGEAREIKTAYLEALPGVTGLIKSLKSRARAGQPIRTWGGRVYYVEPPRVIEGQLRTFDYKLLNVLCQGSAADLTKEAMIRYNTKRQHGKLVVTIHDQIVISVPKEHWKTEAKILQDCMENLELDAKLLADGSEGPNLHDLTDFT